MGLRFDSLVCPMWYRDALKILTILAWQLFVSSNHELINFRKFDFQHFNVGNWFVYRDTDSYCYDSYTELERSWDSIPLNKILNHETSSNTSISANSRRAATAACHPRFRTNDNIPVGTSSLRSLLPTPNQRAGE